jgi:hypothetical protein
VLSKAHVLKAPIVDNVSSVDNGEFSSAKTLEARNSSSLQGSTSDDENDDVLAALFAPMLTSLSFAPSDEDSALLARRNVESNIRLPLVMDLFLGEDAVDSEEEQDEDHWHFATQTHRITGPLKYLVNVPQRFLQSTQHTQLAHVDEKDNCVFVNCSSRWHVHVSEVVAGGLLLLKGVLLPGDRFAAVVAEDSVWMVSAFQQTKSSTAHGHAIVTPSTPLNTVFAYSKGMLDNHHKLSLLWIPGVSVSMSHSTVAQEPRRRRSSVSNQHIAVSKSFYYPMQIQILDAPPLSIQSHHLL